MFLDEWKYVFRTKGLLRIILGILLIPTFYAVIFLASLWNPYSNVKHLPVGIVDNDVKIVKHQTSYSLGKALTNRLTRTNDALKTLEKNSSRCSLSYSSTAEICHACANIL